MSNTNQNGIYNETLLATKKKKKEITFILNFFKVHMTAYSKNYNIVL